MVGSGSVTDAGCRYDNVAHIDDLYNDGDSRCTSISSGRRAVLVTVLAMRDMARGVAWWKWADWYMIVSRDEELGL